MPSKRTLRNSVNNKTEVWEKKLSNFFGHPPLLHFIEEQYIDGQFIEDQYLINLQSVNYIMKLTHLVH